MNIEEMKARIKEIRSRLHEMRAVVADRNFSEDEKGEWNLLNEELDGLQRSLEEREMQRASRRCPSRKPRRCRCRCATTLRNFARASGLSASS